jgi:hypothetical protein
MPYGSTARFVHQELRAVPAGYKVRTVRAGTHQVRVAFPPGPRQKGSGIVVGVLHPRGENPCPVARTNPAELILMGGNPPRSVARGSRSSAYDRLTRTEKLAFGRLGLGKKQIQTEADVEKARRMVAEAQRLKNRLPNPPGSAALGSVDGAEAAAARNLREGFSGESSERYIVRDEPHVPVGDYTDCGEFIEVAVKPTSSGETAVVQGVSFPGKLRLICDPDGRQLYIVGGSQHLSDSDVRIFTSSESNRVELGECRVISYGMVKWGPEVPISARGEDARWDHKFGEDGGTCPKIHYDRKMKRLLLDRATYRIEGAWIRD